MLDKKSFREEAHKLVDWMADFYDNIETYPVKSKARPGDVIRQLPKNPPIKGESFDQVFKDFESIILPGMTQWQSPNFHAYFPANSSYPSVLGEMLTATLGAQCMIWETSPAAAELEELIINWLKPLMNIPANWTGCIQDTASTATLAAMISAREQKTNWSINQNGFDNQKLRFYCSSETHSSIDKAIKVLGAGAAHLVKVDVDEHLAILPAALEAAIEKDIKDGFTPCAVVAAVGTTGTLAIDPIDTIGDICNKYDVWLHVDAAYAGTALMLPEYHSMIKGIEKAHSLVFNPHKWMFTNFDCTVYYIKDEGTLIKTFEILPEYLKTSTRGHVKDYRDWGVPLGRRFRALKLWFVIRDFGIEGIQTRLREHISYAQWFANQVVENENFELVIEPALNVVCFRMTTPEKAEDQLDQLNAELIGAINDSGEAYLTHTKVNGKYTLRMVIGQTYVQKHHIEKTWRLIQNKANLLN
ncbi:aromatic-L-amino-acid decarboxylase [Reichenbachiella faecimaris]|uniref:Aromatic-L-amino-acid decarboxylase n=1 Tax=Reichenbachiella faecimaris TaxID=692418 RepID=A0A1W2G8Q4_REIFA|nr:pyridoxal-dependent decarboxylase [Reichenbachiella faecimaris]SMD32708.1 aromatic-L-amino-acid decarboxylase [Reichenbachiella faecimaris]